MKIIAISAETRSGTKYNIDAHGITYRNGVRIGIYAGVCLSGGTPGPDPATVPVQGARLAVDLDDSLRRVMSTPIRALDLETSSFAG